MQKQNKPAAQVATQQVSVHARNIANNAIVRLQQRIAAVQQLRASKNAARKFAAQQQAFALAVQQAAAQYGVTPQQAAAALGLVASSARANSATVQPSVPTLQVQGTQHKPCAAVHALCAQLVATDPHATRKQMLQLCTDNGINPATASTQVGRFRAANKLAAQ
jgi:phage FluMu gp28-like protein